MFLANTLFPFLAFASAILGISNASAIPAEDVNAKRQSCENTPTSRNCWGDYDLTTNWYDVTPSTRVTKEYWLMVENTTMAPDGFSRFVLTYNGTIPGPAIIADWGDDIVVHVTNTMAENGTTVHWHGIRQLENSQYDGVPGVSQCPIAPGQTMTYKFPATQYGSSWYHSHYALQYADGLYGPLIINGPTSANYDEDLGALMVQDWNHVPAEQLWEKVRRGGPPQFDDTLINGTGPYNCASSTNANCVGGGQYFETEFISGTSYKIRVINVGIDMKFRFQIDHHDFQVVAMDLVPIVPYTTDNILVGIAQRYDIIVNANATDGGNYWLRAVWQTSCQPSLNPGNAVGIIRYNSSSTALPTTTPATTYPSSCLDEPLSSLVPYLPLNASQSTLTNIAITSAGGSPLPWLINGNGPLLVNWSDPTILKEYNNQSFPSNYNVFTLPTANQWVSFLITNPGGPGTRHPLHLHGHDFWILGQSSSAYTSSTVLNYNNPPRRDVATLIPGGFLAIAFPTDNPGSWLMHCHIAWHASESLAWQFVERQNEITGTLEDPKAILDTCSTWDAYYNAVPPPPQEDDSGI